MTMNESPIYTRTYDLLLWLLPHTVNFPRAYRFTIGERVARQALDFHAKLIAAGIQTGTERLTLLRQADVELSQLRHILRLCKDLRLFSLPQYEHAAGLLVQIGKLLGGWQKKA